MALLNREASPPTRPQSAWPYDTCSHEHGCQYDVSPQQSEVACRKPRSPDPGCPDQPGHTTHPAQHTSGGRARNAMQLERRATASRPSLTSNDCQNHLVSIHLHCVGVAAWQSHYGTAAGCQQQQQQYCPWRHVDLHGWMQKCCCVQASRDLPSCMCVATSCMCPQHHKDVARAAAPLSGPEQYQVAVQLACSAIPCICACLSAAHRCRTAQLLALQQPDQRQCAVQDWSNLVRWSTGETRKKSVIAVVDRTLISFNVLTRESVSPERHPL